MHKLLIVVRMVGVVIQLAQEVLMVLVVVARREEEEPVVVVGLAMEEQVLALDLEAKLLKMEV